MVGGWIKGMQVTVWWAGVHVCWKRGRLKGSEHVYRDLCCSFVSALSTPLAHTQKQLDPDSSIPNPKPSQPSTPTRPQPQLHRSHYPPPAPNPPTPTKNHPQPPPPTPTHHRGPLRVPPGHRHHQPVALELCGRVGGEGVLWQLHGPVVGWGVCCGVGWRGWCGVL